MFTSANESATATTAGAGAVEIALDMAPRRQYKLTARGAALWFKVVVTGAAGADAAVVAGSGSHYLPNGTTFEVAAIGPADNPATRKRISIIRDGGTDASGVLSELPTVQPI